MNERKLPRYQPKLYDPNLMKASLVPEGSTVTVFLTRQGMQPFEAQVISIEATGDVDPRVRTVIKEPAIRVHQNLEEVVFNYGQEIFLGGGTAIRVKPKR